MESHFPTKQRRNHKNMILRIIPFMSRKERAKRSFMPQELVNTCKKRQKSQAYCTGRMETQNYDVETNIDALYKYTEQRDGTEISKSGQNS